jgi:DNA-binding winged helix-turn-helix (wHTH) protein
VWGEDGFIEPRTVDVHLTRLRTKLSERSGSERYIETVRGVGYRFRDQPVADTIPQQDAKLRLAHSSKWRIGTKVKVP